MLSESGSLNTQEYAAGTDPHNPDTDGDTALDGEDIYPLDPHFALKRTGETSFAVIEIVNDAAVERAKLNNFNSVIPFQKSRELRLHEKVMGLERRRSLVSLCAG